MQANVAVAHNEPCSERTVSNDEPAKSNVCTPATVAVKLLHSVGEASVYAEHEAVPDGGALKLLPVSSVLPHTLGGSAVQPVGVLVGVRDLDADPVGVCERLGLLEGDANVVGVGDAEAQFVTPQVKTVSVVK